MSLPTGTITFLFTDIEGSTRLLQDLGNGAYGQALADHHRLLRAAFQENGGEERESQGDGLFFTFPSAKAAVRAAVAAQRAVLGHPWPEGASVRVRMGLHTGEPVSGETGYVGVDIHRAARICAAAHGGQVVFSQTTHDLVADDVPDGMSLRDLGQHRLKDLTHPQHLFQAVVADLPADFPPLKSLNALPNNLPIQLTSFIGRDQEKAEVKQLLSRARLVTLTGSGGAGKTRLALQVAADVLEQFKDGVWVAELAPLSDPGLVPKVVASAMNVPEQPSRALSETLVDSLRSKALLLVLDNCEHLLSACMQMADRLLRACPKVQILATSRAALGLPGEALWRVPSLSLPDPQSRPSLEQLAQSEAVRLFVERAVFSHQGFAVTSRNAAAVVQVCHRLDGIPLAIELAAARVKVLTVEQIAARLDDRFRLLTGGSLAVLPRQQTLRATMDWSYGLLSDQEQVLLRRLSVFAGGWTLEAAEAICVGDDVEALEVLDLLTQLVEKSLVMAEEHGQEVRYRLLETVRQYARDKLLVAVETIEVQRRHRDWYLGLAERMAQKRWGPDQAVGLDRLESEHDNLRAALAWSLEEGGAEAGLRLAGALGWFWHTRGNWSEGRERLKAVLSLSGSSPPSARAKALFWAARLALRQHDRKLARSLYDESLSLFRELGSKHDMAVLLDDLGVAAQEEGDYEAARSLHEESLATFRDSNERNGLGFALLHLGELAGHRGDVETARSHLGESLVIFRELGDRNGIASSLRDLGWLARHQGDYEAARSHFEESLTIYRGLGNKQWVGGHRAIAGSPQPCHSILC